MKRLNDNVLNTLDGLMTILVAMLWLAVFVHPWAGAAIWGASIVLHFKISEEVDRRAYRKWKPYEAFLDELEN